MAARALQGKEGLREVVGSLEKVLGGDLVAVVLFGSQARGEADVGSDWDLLILAHRLPGEILTRHQLLKRALPETWRGRAAILAKTPAEFEAHLPALWLDIALDGIVLFDPQDYARERLKRLRRLVNKVGLTRERVGRDLLWQWKRFPGFNWSLEWEQVE